LKQKAEATSAKYLSGQIGLPKIGHHQFGQSAVGTLSAARTHKKKMETKKNERHNLLMQAKCQDGRHPVADDDG
jgi:hypothetical protein